MTWHIVKIINLELLKKVNSHAPGVLAKTLYPYYTVKSHFIQIL